MKNLVLLFFLFSTLTTCSKKPIDLNNEAIILKLEIEANGTVVPVHFQPGSFSATITLPYGSKEIKINTLWLSEGASSSKKEGYIFVVGTTPAQLTITSESKNTSNIYTVSYNLDEYTPIVLKHGLLKVSGNKIVNKNNESVSLAGNSFFWSNDEWGGERYYKSEVVSWLVKDWKTTIIRAAIGVDDPGGYMFNPQANKARLKTLVDAAIKEGIYVIIDWHSHYAHLYPDEAVAFFQEMASTYGAYDNIIYEIYNEPKFIDKSAANDGKFATWDAHIKPYAEKVISAIRAIDPDNLIVVGTGEWSQKVDDAAKNPITTHQNIAYVLHFYSVHHKQWLRDRASAAISKGLPIFVSEWGSVGYTQNDPETDLWMKWCKDNKMIHLNWAVNDKSEEWSVVKQNASTTGNWSENDLTEAGKLAKRIISTWK